MTWQGIIQLFSLWLDNKWRYCESMRVDIASAFRFRCGCWLRERPPVQLIVGLPIGDEDGVLFSNTSLLFFPLIKSYDCSASRPGFKAVPRLISSVVLFFQGFTMGVTDIQSGSVYRLTNVGNMSCVLDLSGENERQRASCQNTISLSFDDPDCSHRIF